MKDLYGKDLGNKVEFRRYEPRWYEVQCPWPEETVVSAGRGVVISKKTHETKQVLFMEVYAPGSSFIRGEGENPTECEQSCWDQYQKALSCPGTETGEHEYEPRGYKNGAGFCKHCSTFKHAVFTGADLKQFCHECGLPTTYSWDEEKFGCENHPVEDGDEFIQTLLAAVRERYENGDLAAILGAPGTTVSHEV